ncbi:hypothetical protein HMPREF9073_01915 [Capnocytophaga sp. oral taxon 326 str. F0382]|nr:hypothetical protein HMPREF9073_01915 [Capnocytophaga sp. oral taxon 326 str. F0382]
MACPPSGERGLSLHFAKVLDFGKVEIKLIMLVKHLNQLVLRPLLKLLALIINLL